MGRGFIAVALAASAVAGCGSDGGDGGQPTVTVTETTDSGTKPPQPEPDAPAEVLVSESGFSLVESSGYYGVVLENPSRTQEARGVKLVIRARDRRKDVIAREVVEVAVVPPGARFNVGGALQVGERDKIANLDAVAKTADAGPPENPLARVTNVRVEPHEYGGLRVQALIENTLLSNLPARSRLYAVLRDGDDQIVGGLAGAVGHVIRPRERSPIELELTEDLPAAVKAGVSVDSPVVP